MRIKRIVEMEVERQELKAGDKIQIADSLWKVLEKTEDQALIWKCTNITDHVFNKNNSNVYEGSDIQKYLREEFPETMPVDFLGDVTKEGFFLLTEEQIKKYMPKELDRIATDKEDYTTWYWTASPFVGDGYHVRLISPAGLVNINYAIISGGVAPACWIHL